MLNASSNCNEDNAPRRDGLGVFRFFTQSFIGLIGLL